MFSKLIETSLSFEILENRAKARSQDRTDLTDYSILQLSMSFHLWTKKGKVVKTPTNLHFDEHVSGLYHSGYKGLQLIFQKPVWVTLARRSHPFPSRTRKLSSSGPMVLRARVCGRVGSRPIQSKPRPPGAFCFSASVRPRRHQRLDRDVLVKQRPVNPVPGRREARLQALLRRRRRQALRTLRPRNLVTLVPGHDDQMSLRHRDLLGDDRRRVNGHGCPRNAPAKPRRFRRNADIRCGGSLGEDAGADCARTLPR